MILGVAVGLTNYLVGAQVPASCVEWARGAHRRRGSCSCWCLNVFLLVVGWLMEIFAAIVVVVPLIVPLGAAFGIHPVHLGIIFIANLELGYPDAARRAEHLSRVLPLQAAGAGSVRARRCRCMAILGVGVLRHHLCAVAAAIFSSSADLSLPAGMRG